MDITSFKTEKVKIINRYQAESNSDVIIRFSSIECSQIASAGMYIKIKSKNVLIENLYQIMRVSKINKWLEILCDQNNAELNFSNFVKNNDPIILIGPSGNGFSFNNKKNISLLVGEGLGISPLIFLADEIKKTTKQKPILFFGSNDTFPYKYSPSKYIMKDFHPAVTASPNFIESMGFVSRLASKKNIPGCYNGNVTDLVEDWIKTLDLGQIKRTNIYACGTKKMLKNISIIARKYKIECQICILDHLGCSPGKCLCLINTEDKDKNKVVKKICDDGPVFSSEEISYD